MLDIFITKGLRVGGIVGSSLTPGYLILILIPITPPMGSQIFWEWFLSDLLYLTISAFVGFLIGGFTGAVFGFILGKFNPNIKKYITICVLCCLIVVAPIYIYLASSYLKLLSLFSKFGYIDGHEAMSLEFLALGTIPATIIYIISR